MLNNHRTILEYIPQYLDFCKQEKKLLPNSIINYNRFLSEFKNWLHLSNYKSLTPFNFDINHVLQYQKYLENRSITQNTANHYIIGLRGLFFYFIEKGISTSLSPTQIKTLKITKKTTNTTSQALNLSIINKLLSVPDTRTLIGSRDKALLSVLLSTGLKVTKLKNLNREDFIPSLSGGELKIKTKQDIQVISIPPETADALQNYLKKRTDTSPTLFINLRNKKQHLSKHLSVRSIERTVEHYTKSVGLPLKITPELLRNVKIASLLKQDSTLMPKGIKHATQKILHYKFYPDFKNAKITKTNLSWNETETIIAEEINWLKQNILTMTSHEPKHPLLHCCDCILRKIALLIVSGNVQTTYFETKSNKIPSIHRHGHDWHKKMMDVVSEYFKKYKIETEPTLHYGRADLQIIINPKTTLYVEIGTVSLFKLWYNLWVMKNTTFLIIPDENYAIEFRT